MNHDVFISYSSQDNEAAQAICHTLEQNEIRCWMAPRDIPSGSEYGDLIDEAIKSSTVVVVLFSETAATSLWVKGELNIAFEEQKVIIPFRLDKTPLKGQNRVILNQKHWIDAYLDYKTKFNELVCAVAQSIGRNIKTKQENALIVKKDLKSINPSERLNPNKTDLERSSPSKSLYIASNCPEQNSTYESVCPFITSSNEADIKELKSLYEKTIACLNQEQKQLELVHYQIYDLKKTINEIESQSKKSSGMIASVFGGFLSSIIGGLVGSARVLLGSTSTLSDKAREKRLECDKELEAKMAQVQMYERQIIGFFQQKNNLEKELAVLEEQNKYNEVYSSIFAPAEVKRKSHLQVQVYLHLYEESEKVKSLAKESDKNAERRDYIPLSLKLKKGDKVDIEFNVYGETRLMSERKSIIWQGAFTKCSFDYFVPKDINVDELSCVALLSVNGVPVGEMQFITQVVELPRQLNPEIIAHKYSKVFVSYSHQDESKVKFLHEGLELGSVPHFFDRKYLKAGDVFPQVIQDYINSADLFILCWSENASKSEYVQKERLQALGRAFPQVKPENAAKLRIYPMSIEPRAELPSDMKEIYNFEVI